MALVRPDFDLPRESWYSSDEESFMITNSMHKYSLPLPLLLLEDGGFRVLRISSF